MLWLLENVRFFKERRILGYVWKRNIFGNSPLGFLYK